jgi:hypothetical protein
MNYTNYYNEIRSDIAKEFGLEAGGYAPAPTMLPIRIAQRIVTRYPLGDNDLSTRGLSPKAVYVAKRYMSLVMGVNN